MGGHFLLHTDSRTYVPATPSDMALLSSGVGCGCARIGGGGAVSPASGKNQTMSCNVSISVTCQQSLCAIEDCLIWS